MKSKFSLFPKLNAFIFIMLFIITSLPQVSAYADPGSPIYLAPTLTTTFDGAAPLPTSLDNSTTNHIVANNDSVGQDFDFTVNTNDGNSHNLDYVILTATLNPAAGSALWDETSLPNSCIGQYPGARKVSVDRLTISCKINGPFVIGSVNKISATWSPSAITPNNTNVDVSFTVSGVMTPDSFYPTPINPDDVTSSTESITAVSASSGIETRKWPGAYNINRNNGTGAPESVTFSWGVTFGLMNPLANTVKGANSNSLGDITLNDDLSSMGTLWQNATLDSCGIGVAGDNMPIPIGVSSTPMPYGNRSAVKNAGTFNCTQAGGAGTNINISNTGIDYNSTWFPFGYVNATPAAYYGMNTPGIPNEVWDSPIGTNNHAVVSAGYVTTTIPWNDILAFDTSGNDPIPQLNTVRVCNTVSDLNVVGSDPSFVDQITDNSACTDVGIGTGESSTKRFSLGGANDNSVNEYINSQPASFGSVSPNNDNVVLPGEKLFSQLLYSNNSTSITAISSPQMCDTIDNSNLQIVANDFYGDLSGYNSFVSYGYTQHNYHSAKLNAITNVTGFPAGTVPSESDIIVEYSSVAPMTTSSELRTFDCDTVGSGDWHLDPNDVTGGITKANVIRVRLTDGKDLIPGRRIEVSVSMQVLPNKQVGDIVQNVMRSRSGTTTNTQTSNVWTNLTSACEVYNWGVINNFPSNCDRAYVVPPNGHLELTDNVDTSVNGTQHRAFELLKSVQAGTDWTFDLRASMSYNGNIDIENAKAYVVFPEGITFKSSTLSPSDIIGDCDASINPSCITNPGSRTNLGYSSAIWELGDYQFQFPSGNDPGVAYVAEGFFGYWKVTAHTDLAFTNGIKRQTRAWLVADSGLATQSVTWPTVEGTWGGYYDNASNGRFDDDWISFTQTAQFIISKWTPDFFIPIDGQGRYDITYTNASTVARTFDFIDVLPYNGDNRVPPSNFTGTISLDDIDLSRAPNISQTYVTSQTSSTINPDPASNVAVGTGIWSCTLAQVDTVGCPTSAQVTGIRFTTLPLAATARETVRITIDTQNNTGRDIYTNNAMGRASGLTGEIHSEDVYFKTKHLQVGNRVFVDINNNGYFDSGDTPVVNVEMQLRLVSDDSIVNTTTTDTNGYYILNTDVEGNYYIRIAPSELQNNGALTGYRAQKFGSSNIRNDNDETQDHNARMYSSTNIRSSNFNLTNLGEPVGEAGDSGLWDSSSNLTIDFALELPASIGNFVWLDLNNDGLQSLGEPGIGGITITALYYGDDDTLGGGDDETFNVTTDSSGQWQIVGPAGTYAVSYTLPAGYEAAKSNIGSDDTIDSDINGVVESVLVDATNLNYDFGLVGYSTIGDTIYYDVNGNGIQEVEDIGLANISVTLTWFGIDNIFGGGDDMVLTTSTNSEGVYLFTGLPIGSYKVSVDTSTLPSNIRQQSYDPDSKFDAVSYPVLSALLTSDLTHDFAFTRLRPSDVSGNDAKANGSLANTGYSGLGSLTALMFIIGGLVISKIFKRRTKMI